MIILDIIKITMVDQQNRSDQAFDKAEQSRDSGDARRKIAKTTVKNKIAASKKKPRFKAKSRSAREEEKRDP